MNFKMSKVLAEDLLQKESKYVKDSQLTLNRIVLTSTITGEYKLHLYYDTYHLATIEINDSPEFDMTFDFQLTDGSMKLHFDNDGACNSPDPYKNIKEAIAMLLNEIEIWKGRSMKSEQ